MEGGWVPPVLAKKDPCLHYYFTGRWSDLTLFSSRLQHWCCQAAFLLSRTHWSNQHGQTSWATYYLSAWQATKHSKTWQIWFVQIYTNLPWPTRLHMIKYVLLIFPCYPWQSTWWSLCPCTATHKMCWPWGTFFGSQQDVLVVLSYTMAFLAISTTEIWRPNLAFGNAEGNIECIKHRELQILKRQCWQTSKETKGRRLGKEEWLLF